MTPQTLQQDPTPVMPAKTTAPAQHRNPFPVWANVILGLYLAFAPLWTPGAPLAWFTILGTLIAGVTLWTLGHRPTVETEWATIILGTLTFLTPGVADFTDSPFAAWTAWTIGVLVMIFAPTAPFPRKAQPATEK